MNKQKYSSFKVLGTQIDVMNIFDTVERIEEFIRSGSTGRFVALINSHLVMEGHKDVIFMSMLNSANIKLPDGMPLLYLAKRHGFSIKNRVSGSALMESFLCRTDKKYTHFFYGGKPAVTRKLMLVLTNKYPEIRISGFYSPPFKQLSEEEDADVIKRINSAKPDILWVGLGAPKQEKWIYEHRHKIKVPVMVGVGAAFDFISCVKPRAPVWMQEIGLEWLFRLIIEPGRLWYRYLILGPKFVICVLLEYIGLIKIEPPINKNVTR